MALTFLDPGMLRHRIRIEALTDAPDGAGGFKENWQETAECFAQVEPLSVKQNFTADQADERATHRITIRYRQDVQSGQRFVFDSRSFRIVTVHDPDETKRYLICRTEEIQ